MCKIKIVSAALCFLTLAAGRGDDEAARPLVRGKTVAIPAAPRPVEKSARRLVETLRENGLKDADIIEVCGATRDFASLPEGVPAPTKLPRGIMLDEFRVLRLKDPWRLTVLDQKSIRKRATQYALGIGLDFGKSKLDPTGPFLLAAALKIKDEESAAIIYGRMSGEFATDADALELGITSLAWSRFLKGLNAYQMKRDPAALAALGEVVKLKRFAKPSSLLGSTVAQSAALITEITARLKEKPGIEPKRSEEAAYIRYWIGQIREIDGYQMGQPNSPSIWYEDYKLYPKLRRTPFASDRLRAVGLAALPALLAAMGDHTPTRTVGYWRDFYPSRYLVSVSQAALQIFEAIAADYGLKVPKQPEPTDDETPAARAGAHRTVLADWLKTIPAQTKRLTDPEREKFLLDRDGHPPTSDKIPGLDQPASETGALHRLDLPSP